MGCQRYPCMRIEGGEFLKDNSGKERDEAISSIIDILFVNEITYTILSFRPLKIEEYT